jgi:hypothetical protein
MESHPKRSAERHHQQRRPVRHTDNPHHSTEIFPHSLAAVGSSRDGGARDPERRSRISLPWIEFIISWLNHTPHATAVYASCSALPPPHATLASRRPATALLGPDLHRLIAPALPGAFPHWIGTRPVSGGRSGHTEEAKEIVARLRQRDPGSGSAGTPYGLRSSELVDLQWDQIDFVHKTVRINRVKNGTGSTHYLSNSELRALRRLQRENPPGPHVFVSERGGPVTTAWFRKMMPRLGERARMPFLIHPHMLRHSCGFKYANEGKDTRSLQAGYCGAPSPMGRQRAGGVSSKD